MYQRLIIIPDQTKFFLNPDHTHYHSSYVEIISMFVAIHLSLMLVRIYIRY